MPARRTESQLKHDDCSKRCGRDPKIFYDSAQYCLVCYRSSAMIKAAKAEGKVLPTFEWCEREILNTPTCPNESCGKTIRLDPDIYNKSDAISLQHNLDGTMTLVCHSCNVGHGGSKLGDKYWDLKPEEKLCPDCDTVKNRDLFFKNKSRPDGLQNICKACGKIRKQQIHHKKRSSERAKERYVENPEKMREIARKYRESNREEINRKALARYHAKKLGTHLNSL